MMNSEEEEEEEEEDIPKKKKKMKTKCGATCKRPAEKCGKGVGMHNRS